MSSNDGVKEDIKQHNLADYNSSSFSFDDEDEGKSVNYGKSHNFVADDVVQEDDLPGDLKEYHFNFVENNTIFASNRLSSELDQELELLENEVENEGKDYLNVGKVENEVDYSTVEKVENEEIEKYEEEKNYDEYTSKYSPPPQTPQEIAISSSKENQQKQAETPIFNNFKIDDSQTISTKIQQQLQTQQSTDCEQKLFDQIVSKNTVANLVAKFNAVATTSDEKSNGVNAKLKQDISGASIKINELRQRFNDDK
uniref:Uncharacterized protein n=1 Tax=Meloidogyne hapla TaxID=6305 RepID=A0A1I8C139_MELHA